ncbi:MAG: ExbD/TolR family protein [Bacteriovoracia bacterium]
MASLEPQDSELSGINVTPLVDVVLVLLVIFMITAPTLYQQSMSVQLPETKSKNDSTSDILQIGVDPSGKILISGKEYSLEDLKTYANKMKPKSAILLADRKAEHGRVVSIMDTLKSTGIEKFSFAVLTSP